MEKEKWYFQSKWLVFYFDWNFDISYETCGYFDPRHRIILGLIFFRLLLVLPIKSKHTHECQSPKWGIAYHNQTLWIYRGGKGNMNGGTKWWTVNMPWQYDWVRTSTLRKDGTWEHEIKGDRKQLWEDKWKEILWAETHPFTYILRSGEVQNRFATIRVREMEHRQLWLKWSSFNNRIKKRIEIDFDQEVGERTGSWKGGCLGCSHELRKNETPLESLRRMEATRKF